MSLWPQTALCAHAVSFGLDLFDKGAPPVYGAVNAAYGIMAMFVTSKPGNRRSYKLCNIVPLLFISMCRRMPCSPALIEFCTQSLVVVHMCLQKHIYFLLPPTWCCLNNDTTLEILQLPSPQNLSFKACTQNRSFLLPWFITRTRWPATLRLHSSLVSREH